MKKTFQKTVSFLLCVWLIAVTGIAALAASEQPYETANAIQLSSTTLSMVYGGTAQLTATVLPEGVNQKVTWKSSNTALVQVDANGKLTAAKDTAQNPSGKKTVTITATSVQNPSVSATCTVTVDNDLSTKLSVIFKELVNVFQTLVNTFAGPAKQFSDAIINFFLQLVAVLTKSAPAAI